MGATVSRGGSEFTSDTYILKGSIFDADSADSLVCFVTKDFTMNGRIQTEFKRRFGSREWLKNQGKNKGEIVAMLQNSRYIYYVIVKNKDYIKGTTTDLRAGLDAVVTHAIANSITEVGIPECSYSEITATKTQTESNGAFNGSSVNHTFYTEKLSI